MDRVTMDRITQMYRTQFRRFTFARYSRVVEQLRRTSGGTTSFALFSSAVEVSARATGNEVFYQVFTETWFHNAISRYNNTVGDLQTRLDAVDDNTWDDAIANVLCMGWYTFLCGDFIKFAQYHAAAA